MRRGEARHHGPGDPMPGDEGDAADGSISLRGVVPWTTCIFACGLWLGCAMAGGSRWSGVEWAACADAMAAACLGSAAGCAIGAIAMAVRAAMGRCVTRASGAAVAILVGLCAVSLGAGLRFEETVEAARKPRLCVPDEGRLARIEAKVSAPFAERGFAVDLLAKYLVRPTKFVGLVSDVVFIDEAGGRHEIGDPDALLSVAVFDAPPACGVADRVAFVGTVRHIDAARLPGDARMKDFAARRGVVGSVVVESPALVRVVTETVTETPVADAFARLREAARHRVRAALLEGVPDDERFAIRSMLVALVLGDAEDGYRTIENSFRAVGLSHILAISGFNLAVLGWIVGLAARAVSSDERVHAVACGIAALGALVLMAPAASAVRSALMAIVGASGGALGREWNGDAVLAVAAVAMLVAAPSDALGPGFQLSFGCVLALRHLSPPIQARWLAWMPSDDPRRGHPAWLGVAGEFLSRMLASGLAAFVASTPIVLVHFGSLQPYGTVLTLLCAPLSTATLAIAYPKALVGAVWPPLLSILAWPMWLTAWLQIELVELSIRAGAGSIALGGFHWSIGGALAASGCIALCAARRHVRTVAWVAVSLLLLAGGRLHEARTDPPHFECTMFAIGDGTTIAVESGESLILFDGGSSSIGNVATRALLPWIDARGGVVDAIFISHPDLDHLSALADVTRYTRVERVVIHDALLAAERTNPAIAQLFETMRSRGVEFQMVKAGDSMRLGRATWSVLWPSEGYRSRRDNDLSLVLSVEIDAGQGVERPRLLLSGDIETEPAARLAAMHSRGEIDLRCDVLEIPHHGSWREAVVGYIAAANPSFILQSTAMRRFAQDRFQPHLAPDVRRLVTCRDGTLRVSFHPDGGIDASVIDESFDSGMRPAGRAISGRRPRRIRVRWRRSLLSDEATAMNRDAIAGDAVSSVIDHDIERAVLGDFLRHEDGGSAPGCVQDDGLPSGSDEPHRHRGARVQRNRLDERDLGAEGDRAACIDHRRGQREARVNRAVELHRSEPKQRLIGWIDSHLRSCLVAIRRFRWTTLRLAAGRKGRQCRAIEEDRCRLRDDAGDRLRLVGRSKIGIGEKEPPARISLEPDVLRAHDAAIGRPDKGIARWWLRKRGERDGRDAVGLDTANGRSCFGWLVGLIRGLRFGGGRLKRHLVADRLDETGGEVAVHEQDRVGVGPRGCAARRDKTHLGEHIRLDLDRADPTMIPARGPCVCTQHAGKELPVAEDERATCKLREELHRAPLLGVDEARDDRAEGDLGGLRLHTRIRTEHRAARRVERIDPTFDPLPIAQQELDTRGVGEIPRLRGGRRSGRDRQAKRRRDRQRKGGKMSRAKVCHGCQRGYLAVLTLEDRKVSLRHLKDDQRHRGPVSVALRIGPGSIGILLREKLVADRRPPGPPPIAASEIHRLNGVVVAVEIVRLREPARETAATAWKRVLLEVVETAFDRLILVDARVEKAGHAGRRARPCGAAKVLHVAEAAVGVLAGANIAGRVVDRGLRHLDARVARASKRHDLTNGDRYIRVVRYGVVAPASFVVLAADDQLHRAHKRVADPIVLLVHPVDLSKEERRKAVAVHRPMRLIRDKESGLGRVIEDEVKRLLHALTELPASREISVRHQRDRAKARHSDMLAKPALSERAIRLLLPTQILESLANRFLESWIDLRLDRRILSADFLRPRGRATRSGFHWVRGHWRRSACGRGRLTRDVETQRRMQRAQSRVRRCELVLTLVVVVLIGGSGACAGLRWLSKTCDKQNSSAREDRNEFLLSPAQIGRLARGPPGLGGDSRRCRVVGPKQHQAQADRHCT